MSISSVCQKGLNSRQTAGWRRSLRPGREPSAALGSNLQTIILTLVAALRGRVLVAEEELDLLLPRAPLLQVFVHHVLEGDGPL